MQVYMYMYAYACIYMCICMCMRIYAEIVSLDSRSSACLDGVIDACGYVCVCICVYVYIYVHFLL